MSQEQNQRLLILNSLLTTPHRKVENLWPLHQDMIGKDPLFYVRLAAWYNEEGEIRDHKETFTASLCLSNFDGHRNVGLALLREMPPYQLCRVLDFVHGRRTVRKVKGGKEKDAPTKEVVENYGLNKNIPRSMKTEIAGYLREREADNDWFDSTALAAHKYLKRMYALVQLKPSERAQQILFDEKPPKDSKVAAFKALVTAKTPQEQAKAIMENKIPYRVASTVVQDMTPTVLLALIDVMSPQELINNMGSLKKRGALNNPDLKALVEKKLELAKKSKRVSSLKAMEAVKAAGVSKDLQEKLENVADTQMKAKGRIRRSTALLIDKSASMSVSVELGKRIASAISAVMDAPLFVYAFDTMAYPIKATGNDLAAWERAFKGITANGGTSCGSPLKMMIRNKDVVEQIIMVTDEEEMNTPAFAATYQEYVSTMGARPAVTFVKTPGAKNNLERDCQNAKIDHDAWQFSGDYYSLPNLIKMLSKPGQLDLLMDIMNWPLPQRRAS